ncbi:MAG: asparaginase [Bacteriovoracaceae bacterium]|jgi:L-asparaginase|nr:asparaginase [Bacteriovoracaceae bacterium]
MRKVVVLTTGGTIEKTYDEEDGTLFNRDTVIKNRIEQRLRLPYTQIEVKSIMAKDSLDMDMSDRVVIFEAIKKFADYGHPIVVLHGTDTMQFSAEFVKREFRDPTVPVVFTGAMKPLGFIDSDAMQNVVEALYVSKVLNPGVYISFHNEIYTVPGVRKNKEKRTFERF